MPISITRAKTPLFNTWDSLIIAPPSNMQNPSHNFSQSFFFSTEETKKFRIELLKKLFKEKETFGDDLYAVVDIFSELMVFSDFLHNGYGGPGTLLVEPFTDMLAAIDRQLPGATVSP